MRLKGVGSTQALPQTWTDANHQHCAVWAQGASHSLGPFTHRIQWETSS